MTSFSQQRRDDPEKQAESEGWVEWFRGYLPPNEIAFEPVVDLFYPIVDDLTHVDISKGNNYTTNSSDIVGVIAVQIYWREFLRDILPPGSNGVVVVIHSPCNLPFTYQLNGPDVQFLGALDKHDSKYDHILVESKVVDLNAFALRAGVYTGAPINENICPYTVSIHASDVMKSDFTSQSGTIALISILLIFAFTSFVFIMYDYSVKLRQDKVMESAVRSSAIVDSLFPSNVREQLYDAQEEKQKREQGIVRNLDEGSKVGNENGAQVSKQASIAQVYTDTTVIFADIVGFTSWSSTRGPTQVFQLLETIFAGFDALAKRNGVFKIETIGDSYVAVVGLPKANKRHAVVMAKFASDCRDKMQELTHELEPFLGPVRYRNIL
jgi:Adenylate and Guanylate cyclase catalytic domain